MKDRSLTQLQPDIAAAPSPLRFYDPELQNASNVEPFDAVRFQRAMQKANQLQEEYLLQIADFADRLSKRTLSLISDPKHPLFDADLFEFSVGDALKYSVPRKRRVSPSASVRATFCSFDQRTLHVMTYTRIASMNIDFPGDRWFDWPTDITRFDSLLADEVTAVDAKLMKHAFLFVSGATISIEFEQIKWDTRRNKLR
jgi:hypothetical protein